MPPKAKIAAPIDRPLSRAYLREFSGWSTAYPPGVSEPTSLRVMENVAIGRDGSVQVRPGLRCLFQQLSTLQNPKSTARPVVGAHEAFFDNTGRKRHLYAVREVDGTIGFRIATRRDPGQSPDWVEEPLSAGFSSISAGFNFSATTTYVKFLQIDNKILALSDAGEAARVFYVSAAGGYKARVGASIPNPALTQGPTVVHPDQGWGGNSAIAAAETPTAKTLIKAADGSGNTIDNNPHQVGHFYTFTNVFGETHPTPATITRVQRPWGAWRQELANGLGEPTGVSVNDPKSAADKLHVAIPQDAFDLAVQNEATAWNLYAFAWSDQASVPVEANLIATVPLTPTSTWEQHGFVLHTPASVGVGLTAPIPSIADTTNYTVAPTASQGVVAADRLVLVNDRANAARIKWTSNLQGEYLNFSPLKGGGFKTLTSGNLNIPACVKLWQNPQSVDTLTVLCLGVDGYSTGYYMAPAQVASQSDAVNIMGFEETTATPGTTSPYGCEVLNNALYHPLDAELMKSTASNYNINHKTMTEQIANMWARLSDKINIVSSQHDNRLYYLVHNPEGEELREGCRGNELWVLDVAAKTPAWMRWLIQGSSLRKLEADSQVYMSVCGPDGVFILDPARAVDDVVDPATRSITQRPIAWRLETNTQGANRAHDAWAHLQQATVTLGNFAGSLRWGVRGRDLHGQLVEEAKTTRVAAAAGDGLPYDVDDHLQVRRALKEWLFFAESIDGVESSGQISLVQYRYAPISVNVGYEYGSVETFEYGSADAAGTTVNGVPIPMVDTSRP